MDTKNSIANKVINRRNFMVAGFAAAGTVLALNKISNLISPANDQIEWNPTEIKIGGAHGNEFDLRHTLPSNVAKGGRFGIDASGANLPEGIFLTEEGMLITNSAILESVQIEGVVFTYSEPV